MLIPFLIGMLEFGLIDSMNSDDLGIWFVLLAALFGIFTATSFMKVRIARRDPANQNFFHNLEAGSWRNYRRSIAATLALALFGGLSWISG
ncbi:MAG: hypothetical protein ACI9GW_001469 [Halieaceae bacterium]|jgi:hypothetical protein